MTTHDTIVIGANENNEILFFRSFNHTGATKEYDELLTEIQKYPVWCISGLNGSWRLSSIQDSDNYLFKIPNP